MTVGELIELAADCTPEQWQAVIDFAKMVEQRATAKAYQQGALDMRERCAKECEAEAPVGITSYGADVATRLLRAACAIRSLTVGET